MKITKSIKSNPKDEVLTLPRAIPAYFSHSLSKEKEKERKERKERLSKIKK